VHGTFILYDDYEPLAPLEQDIECFGRDQAEALSGSLISGENEAKAAECALYRSCVVHAFLHAEATGNHTPKWYRRCGLGYSVNHSQCSPWANRQFTALSFEEGPSLARKIGAKYFHTSVKDLQDAEAPFTFFLNQPIPDNPSSGFCCLGVCHLCSKRRWRYKSHRCPSSVCCSTIYFLLKPRCLALIPTRRSFPMSTTASPSPFT
jgi:hypothetical protein